MKLKYFIKDLEFLKAYNSPFKPPKPILYVGKVAIGTPYFLPRKWVKGTPALAIEATLKYIKETERWNEQNPKYKRIIKSFEEIYKDKLTCSYAVPKIIGFNYTGLGWKTKWEHDDYRFEWSPVFSFVFFKWQIAVSFIAPERLHYWECWLYYTRETKHVAKTTKARLALARKKFPCIWSSNVDGKKEEICYWDVVLKDKWL